MKYKIPQERLYKLVFRYLDMQYGDLKKIDANYYDIILKKPNSEDGIIGYMKKQKNLYIYYTLIDEISGMFSLDEDNAKEVIGRWVEDRHQIEVSNTIDLSEFQLPPS